MDNSILNNIKSKSSWNLSNDEQLIKYLESFSNSLNKQLKDISNNLNSLSQLSKVTKINLNHVINDFDSAANNQFIENRVYEDDVYIRKNNSSEVSIKRSKEEIEAAIISNFKTAITCSLKSIQDFPTQNSSVIKLSHCIIGSKEFSQISTKIVNKIKSPASLKIQDSSQNYSDKISNNSSNLDDHSTISNEFNNENTMNFDYALVNSFNSRIDSKVNVPVKGLFENENSDNEDMFANVMQINKSSKDDRKADLTFDNDDEDLFGDTRLKFNLTQKPILPNEDKTFIHEIAQSTQLKSNVIDRTIEDKSETKDIKPNEIVNHRKPVKVLPTSIFGDEDDEDENNFFNILANKSTKSDRPIKKEKSDESYTPIHVQQPLTFNKMTSGFPYVARTSPTDAILNKEEKLILDGSSNKLLDKPGKSPKKEKSTDCDSALIPLLCVHG